MISIVFLCLCLINSWQKNRPLQFFVVLFVSFFSQLPVTMDNPNVALLCPEQRDHSLETHTRDFLELVCLTHYPDCSLCVFYISSLSEWSKACLPGSGPRDNFAACVEWVLENNGLYFSICPADEDIFSPTPKPETVSRHPTARSYCLSPLQMESLSPLRLSWPSPRSLSLSHRLTKCVSRQHRPFPRELWWRSRAWREALSTLPRLRVSCNWFLGAILRN